MNAQFCNILFVTLQGASVRKRNETVLVVFEGEAKLRVPLHHISGIVCFGRVFVSPETMAACAQNGIGISFISEWGRFLARVVGPVCGNVLLRREQYRRADDSAAAIEIARSAVLGKIANSRVLLQRARRERSEIPNAQTLQRTIDSLGCSIGLAAEARDIDELRGCEGEAARTYFSAFNFLIISQDQTFHFNGRNRRPPKDAANALISFAYSMLMHDCASALQAIGLDPAVGYLHADRPGRLSLALDLMEEFRAAIADRFVAGIINLGQIKADDIITTGSGAVVLTDEGRKKFLAAWQKRKQEEITHPFGGEKTTYALLPYYQARLLARTIRGDLGKYPPYLLK